MRIQCTQSRDSHPRDPFNRDYAFTKYLFREPKSCYNVNYSPLGDANNVLILPSSEQMDIRCCLPHLLSRGFLGTHIASISSIE